MKHQQFNPGDLVYSIFRGRNSKKFQNKTGLILRLAYYCHDDGKCYKVQFGDDIETFADYNLRLIRKMPEYLKS